ncbi:hypothetical protein [Ottowia sp.]|uniref:hypothetical protein n=1 Tax=Ottowia sp. TaxID=1898956 RepID=UPI0025DFC50D|nr:hypothetical protein [Ottowia sp.]
MTRTTIKTTAMACLTIGYHDYLMPSDKAMKVAELMQHAVNCDRDFDGNDYVYKVREEPAIRFSLVRPDRVCMPQGQAAPVTPKQRFLR